MIFDYLFYMSKALRILLIDDNRDVRESLADFLLGSGFEVRLARHGKEALANLREDPRPALIFLDLMMPVMNGWEFRAALANLDPKDSNRLVTLTSVNANFGDEALIKADASLQKPVSLTELLGVTERFCERACVHPIDKDAVLAQDVHG